MRIKASFMSKIRCSMLMLSKTNWKISSENLLQDLQAICKKKPRMKMLKKEDRSRSSECNLRPRLLQHLEM